MGKKDSWDTSNSDRHVVYSQDDIMAILSLPPTRRSCLILGPILKRSSYAITMVYRIASIPTSEFHTMERGRDKFIQQVKCVAKKVGWISHSNIIQYMPKKNICENEVIV